MRLLAKTDGELKVSAEHGVVSGWAIVCKVFNATTGQWEDYYDLNVDQDGVHKGKRVPENITGDAVIKALIDAAEVGVMVGNEMHAGPDSGKFLGMVYIDDEIAKASGMTTVKAGLFVQYKPTPEVLEKFKDGTYTGFSIEGGRIESELLEDA